MYGDTNCQKPKMEWSTTFRGATSPIGSASRTNATSIGPSFGQKNPFGAS